MYKAENNMAKAEIARSEQFLLLPQCFQKLSAEEVLKKLLYVEKVKVNTALMPNQVLISFISQIHLKTLVCKLNPFPHKSAADDL